MQKTCVVEIDYGEIITSFFQFKISGSSQI